MTSPTEATLAYWKEHREQLRQSETQRSVITNILLVIAAALGALVVQQRFEARLIPLTVFIVVIGVYGALAVAKYHERAAYHLSQARALTKLLVELGSLGSEEELDRQRNAHYREFRLLHRVRLYAIWASLHVLISLYGLALLIMCIVAV